MALINKINERSGIIAGVIAVALILFMLGGDILSNNSIFNFGKDKVGEVNGENISLSQYQNVVAKQEEEFAIQADRSVGENERAGIDNQAWNEFITRFAYQPQFDKLGLSVTKEEVNDMVKGKFIHNIIMSAFGGGQGQPFDKANVIGFLQNYDKVQPEIKAKWMIIEAQLPKTRIREKYVSLLKKSEYVTKAEAKRYYAEQNDKAEVKYVFVPYSTVLDSTIKPSNDQLKDYISKNKEKYKVEAGRSLDYIVLNFIPSGADSLATKKDVAEIANNFKTADNDTVFIAGNSDAPSEPKYMGMGELPSDLKNVGPLTTDSVFGPFLSNGKYAIFKVLGTKNDSVYSLKASHILFRMDADKDAAKKKANAVLDSIKRGASFETMAAKYGSDGTSSRGGDLGWFSNNGQMVKQFEDACFKYNGKGLLPTLVETQFGYHIIKVTEPKTNKKYLIASVEKEIIPSDETKDVLYSKVTEFLKVAKDTESFNKEVKKDPTLVRYSMPNATKTERSLSGVKNAREIIRWAYNDAKIGSVSQFTTDGQYVVAVLTAKRDEGTASVDDVKNEVTAKVMNDLKGDQIIEKLSKLSGDFDKIAAAYGSQALTGTAPDVTFSSSSIASIGYDPVACGKVFGMKAGKKSAPFKGESGVVMVEVVKVQPAPEVADYNQQKTQKETQRAGADEYLIDEAIKKLTDVIDDRYKFF